MEAAIIGRISQDTAIPESSIAATVSLFEQGATGPFIAYYRKEASGGLDEAKVRSIQERWLYYKEVSDRRATLLKLLAEQGKLTNEIKLRIESCFAKVELEDIYHRFRPRRRSRATEAIERGLEPLAEYFWNQELDAWSPEEHINVFVDPAKGVSSQEQALQGAVDIIAEWMSENFDYRKELREMLWEEGFVTSTVVPAKINQKTKYNMYYSRRESVATIPSHRVLAIRRGSKEGILTSSIECDHEKALDLLLSKVIRDKESLFAPVLELSIRESYTRILRPLIETEVRTQLKERADREAIQVFQENLANLLLSPPAGPMVVMGIDWGRGNECSAAVVNEEGKFLEGATIRLLPPREESSKKKQIPQTAPQKAVAESSSSETDPEEEPISKEAADLEIPASITKTDEPPISDRVSVMPQADTATPKIPPLNEQPPTEANVTAAAEIPDPETITPDLSSSSVKPAMPQVEAAAPETNRAADPPPVEAKETVAAEILNSETITPDQPSSSAIPVMPQAEATAPEVNRRDDPSPSKAVETNGDNQPPPPQTSGETVIEGRPPDTEVTISTAVTSSKPLDVSNAPDSSPKIESQPLPPKNDIKEAQTILRGMIAKFKVQAIAFGTGTGARELERALRRFVSEEKIENVLIASVNDAGIAVYSSSRVAREEFPDLGASTRCAISLARRLQDPLAELVKVDPKLIGVGQYQHDVDQKELHRGLLQTVQFCVNKVGVNVNTASESLLRYVAGLNDKLARRITAFRNSHGPFPSRTSIFSAIGIDQLHCQQAAAFLRIPDGENPLDRTAVHPESYGIIEKMATVLGVGIADLIENKELIFSLKLEDFVTDTAGLPTLSDIREELLRPGRDPRKTFRVPKFRPDVNDMSDLRLGMILEGTVTNVTNFGAFVDIGVGQDGLVHLSQMSNRFIRDPREAVKVGDVVQAKVISIEPETKRIGLSMKALLPPSSRRRKKQRRGPKPQVSANLTSSSAAAGKSSASEGQSNTGSRSERQPRYRRRGPRKPLNTGAVQKKEESESQLPEPTLQEKIAILQSKFRRIK